MSKPLQCFVCVFEDGFALLQNLERLSGNFKVMKDVQNHGKRIRLKKGLYLILSFKPQKKFPLVIYHLAKVFQRVVGH
mgnify:FL=1